MSSLLPTERNLVTSSGHVGKKFIRPETNSTSTTDNTTLVTSSGHVGKKNIIQKNLYRGYELNPATQAASKMLSSFNTDIRFGINGEEDEIVALMNNAITIEEVATWTKSGGQHCCIVADRNDCVVACTKVTGIRGSNKENVTLEHVTMPLDSIGEKFILKAISMCHGWGGKSIAMHIPTTSNDVLTFLIGLKEKFKVDKLHPIRKGDYDVLTITSQKE